MFEVLIMQLPAEQVLGRLQGAQRQLWQCTVQIRIASGFTDVAWSVLAKLPGECQAGTCSNDISRGQQV